MSSRRFLCLLALLSAPSCRRTTSADAATDVADELNDADPLTLCTRRTVRWWVHTDGDAGDIALSPIGSRAMVLAGNGAETVLWSDTRTRRIKVALGAATLDFEEPAGEHSDPVMTSRAVAITSQAGAARLHTLRTTAGMGFLCDQPEGVDEDFSLTIADVGAPSDPSVLVAWDEPGHQGDAGMNALAPPGTIYAQVVSVAHPGGVGRVCPAPRVLSTPDQDAEDPLALALSDGSAAVFWWASRDIDATEANDTVSDLWGATVGADGRVRQRATRISVNPAHRFGLSAALASDGRSVWLVMREGGETGSEARGDGGEVVLLRVDTRLGTVGDRVTVSEAGSVPSGAPTVLAGPHGAEVWWTDRRDGAVSVMRRAVRANGALVGRAQREPAFVAEGAELPRWSAGVDRVALLAGGGRGVGVARFACGGL